MYETARCWWTILRIGLEERLVYRGDFALGTLMRFLPIVTQVFLWWAIFDTIQQVPGARSVSGGGGGGGAGGAGGATIAGYTLSNMIAYYLLSMVSRAFSSMPGLASGGALQIRNGEIKKFLVQPVDLMSFMLANRVAHKLAYYSVAILPFALVFFFCRGYFVDGWPAPSVLAAYAASLLMGFLLGFFLELSIGLIGFWFLEVSSLLFLYMLLTFFLSGHMFPLDMLPQPWRYLVDLLPLKYLAYFPAAVFLEKVTGPDLVRGLWIEAAWIAFFVVFARIMYDRGVRRYSGFGG